MQQPQTLLVFGHGYSGQAIAAAARAAGWQVTATRHTPGPPADDIDIVGFDAAAPAIARATHIVSTAPPGAAGDPVIARYLADIRAAPALAWIGYLSTTGVYGDRQGGWVDETTTPAPGSERSRRRLAAERQWAALADRAPVDLLRLAGIYGPGRSAFNDLRAGTARRIIAPDHAFGRIHRDDIAGATIAAMSRPAQGVRVLNLSDDAPAPSAEVIEAAADLLGIAPPPARSYAEAAPGMSEMGRSFWSENRKVASRRTQQMLGRAWLYPSYREGLRAIMAVEQRADGAGQQDEIARPG